MSFWTFIPRLAKRGHSHRKLAVAALVAVIALPASTSYAVGSSSRLPRSRAATLASVLRPLTPSERRYVMGIASLTPIQLWAAFGTSPTPPATTSPEVALPILPACAPGACWRAATGAGVGNG